jgi:uncharacterized protein YggE
MRLAPIVLVSLLLLQACNATPVKESTPHISVTGSAFEEVAPDRATIFFAVVTERPSPDAATAENAKTTKAVVDELRTQGVESKDIQTIGVSLAPYSTEERDPRSGAIRRIQKGFRARNELRATINSIDDTGKTARRIVDAGANSIQAIVFDLSDADQHLDKLRAEAVKNAKRQAKIYVGAIGLRLGKALEIAPEPDEGPAPQAFKARGLEAAKAADAIPIEAGRRKLTARVTVTWALTR